jgi:hypothetical protein
MGVPRLVMELDKSIGLGVGQARVLLVELL